MNGRVRLKICGITNRDDAEAAIAVGADALGFNLYPGSKRFIDLEEHSGWIAALPPFVAKVAVLVNAPFDQTLRLTKHPAFDVVQLHGDEDANYCAALAKLGRRFIKALRLRDAADIARAQEFSTPHVLIDAHVEGSYGGTGSPINLALASELVRRHQELRVILAGGLTPENAAEAARVVRPFAIDVATGVEAESGRKDTAKMRALIAAIR